MEVRKPILTQRVENEKQSAELQKLEKVKAEVRKRVSLKINQRRKRADLIPSGIYTWIKNGKFQEQIRIYCRTGDAIVRPHLISGMVIHEFGHYLMQTVSCMHTETEAWDAGEEFFRRIDPALIPEKFYDLRRYCLESYGEYNDDK